MSLDYSTIHPDLFGSPSKTLLSQSSYSSGDTGDFMCEASEQCSFYSPPFSTLIATGGSIPSKDEVSVSFESHHSLLDVRSPLDRKEREGQIHSDSSSGVSDEERTKKTAPIKRQRRVESFGENTVHSVDEVLTPPPVAPVVGESNRQPKVDSLLERSPVRDDTTATPANNSQDDSNSSPDTPRRRARRHAVASCPPPIDVQQLIERRASQETDYPKEETVTTPRQRKTYTIEARLQNPLNLQLQREETAAVVDDIEESTPCGEEEDAPVVSQPDLGFDDDVCPNPPTSPHLPGSSVSVGYSHQSQLDGIRIPAESGRGFGGSGGDGDVSTEEEEEEEGGVVGNSTSSNIEAIENLLAKYPLLSGYSTSSLLAMTSYTSRKMSDSAVIMRNNCSTNSHPHQRHRCVSDSAAPHIIVDDDKNSEVGSSSHNYCDSGYNDEKSSRCHGSSSSAYIPSPRVSLHSSDLLSQEEGLDGGGSSSLSHSKQHRRLTPYMSGNIVCSSVSTSQSKEDTVPTSQEIELGGPAVISSPLGGASGGTMVRPRERSKRSQTKNYSQSSIGASSIGTGASSETISLTSLFETPSPLTVEDMLSNLGFDDFMSPQLIPDRFIPREIEHAKPSIMRTMTLSEYTTHDSPSNSHHSSYEPSIASTSYSAPLPYSHHHTSHSQHHQFHSSSSSISLPGAYTYTGASSEPKTEETAAQTSHTYKIAKDSNIGDLPLGATAENFLAPRSSSPPPPAQSSQQQPEREAPTRNNDARFLNSSNLVTVGFHRGRLETVPEETASDLSPSPRWLSPRVSIDHSVNFDVAEGKLGASLNVQKVRKRSLPTQREGYRLSVGSLVESDTGGDSIHFSVTSYDDEIAAEREKEREDTLPHLSLEDISIHQQRRRRRGVYTPPPALLTWLTQQQPIHEEDVGDPDELPWPFNEQARLRKSLTDIQLAQMALDGSTDVPSDLVNESQFSGSSGKAEGCSSLSSSPPSSIPRSSPGPGEEEENIVPATPRLSNNLSPLRRRHSRDNSTASLSRARANHKTRSLSCQSDYHILRRHLEVPHNPFTNINNGPLGEQDDLLRNEMIEELRYTMSTSQRRLSHALALKGEQCRQLQEELGACRRQLAAAKCEKSASEKRLKQEIKVLLQKELRDLKHKLTLEQMSEIKQLNERHAREISELRQAKAAEIQLLSNRLMERTEASCALSSELRESKRRAEMRENKLRSQMTEEKAKVEKMAHQEKVSSLAKLQDDLSSQKAKELSSLKEKLQSEKRSAVGRVEQKMAEQVTKLQQQLQKVREQGREEVASMEREMNRQLAEERDKSEHLREVLHGTKKELEEAQKSLREVEKKHQTREREHRRSLECQQRDLLTGLLEEWQRSADIAGVRKPRSLSVGATGGGGGAGGSGLNSATETALAGLRTANEALRSQVNQLKEQLEKEKHTSTAAHKAKVAEMRKLRAYAQMDKQKAVREVEERLKKEHAHEIASFRTLLRNGGNFPNHQPRDGAPEQVCLGGSPSHKEQGGVARQVKDGKPAKNQPSPSHSQCKLEICTLRQDLKTQRHAMMRAKALYSEKVQEVAELQSKIKHITKEQLLLEKKIQKALMS